MVEAVVREGSIVTRSDRSELAWEILDPIINTWEDATKSSLAIYDPGSWGPKQGEDLLAKDGYQWMRGCGNH